MTDEQEVLLPNTQRGQGNGADSGAAWDWRVMTLGSRDDLKQNRSG